MEKDKLTARPVSSQVAADEMTEQELDEVSGGIVGGNYSMKVSLGSFLGVVALNPQPLPPKILY